MSTSQTGSIKLTVASFETPRGPTRVVTLGQNHISMNDAELFTGLLVLSCIKSTYMTNEPPTKLRKIIVDMSAVSHINIDVISSFLVLWQQAKLQGVSVVICCFQPEPLELFQKLMLADRMAITATLEQAFEI